MILPCSARTRASARSSQDFLDRHPDCSFQPVNGGGVYGGYEYTRFASTFSFSDGAVGILRNYWASLLLPAGQDQRYPGDDAAGELRQGLLARLSLHDFGVSQDSSDPVKLEGVREMIDIYHYLHQRGGRRALGEGLPALVQGDDPTMYFQRLPATGERGIIIPKRVAPGPVTIKPKGLLAESNYIVSFQESDATAPEHRCGPDGKRNPYREIAPGRPDLPEPSAASWQQTGYAAPSTPNRLTKREAQNMGYPGVELAWEPGKDNNWISHYEIFRNGVFLDKVAKGTFYFDHSAGADLAAEYEVRSVDGASNVVGE